MRRALRTLRRIRTVDGRCGPAGDVPPGRGVSKPRRRVDRRPRPSGNDAAHEADRDLSSYGTYIWHMVVVNAFLGWVPAAGRLRGTRRRWTHTGRVPFAGLAVVAICRRPALALKHRSSCSSSDSGVPVAPIVRDLGESRVTPARFLKKASITTKERL